MRVVEVAQPGVDNEGRWLKKADKSVFGYKQHMVVDGNGLVIAVETTPANRYDSQPFVDLVDKARLKPETRVHADKAYCSKEHRAALKERHPRQSHQEQATGFTPTGPQLGDQQSALCGRAHLWQPTALVWWQDPALPRISQGPRLACSPSRRL